MGGVVWKLEKKKKKVYWGKHFTSLILGRGSHKLDNTAKIHTKYSTE